MGLRARGIRGVLGLLAAAPLWAPHAAVSQPPAPPAPGTHGSFFIGGQDKAIALSGGPASAAESGEITVDQMYVQYQAPTGAAKNVPIVLIHGCCLSSKTWETTPDGRMGWSDYFVRHDYPVYLTDQVSRARSGFDPSAFEDVRAGKAPVEQMPKILVFTHQFAWAGFRFGPKFGEAFPDEQFPVQAVGEFYKQMIPDLNAALPKGPNPTWTNLAALGAKLGGAVLVGHSEAGFFPERAALIDPTGVKGVVTLEAPCDTGLTLGQLATLAKVPTLIVYGDHIDDAPGAVGRAWAGSLASCRKFVDQLKMAGGDAEVAYLPAMGIHGNSHMMMMDRNSDQIAELVTTWIREHVDVKGGKKRPAVPR